MTIAEAEANRHYARMLFADARQAFEDAQRRLANDADLRAAANMHGEVRQKALRQVHLAQKEAAFYKARHDLALADQAMERARKETRPPP